PGGPRASRSGRPFARRERCAGRRRARVHAARRARGWQVPSGLRAAVARLARTRRAARGSRHLSIDTRCAQPPALRHRHRNGGGTLRDARVAIGAATLMRRSLYGLAVFALVYALAAEALPQYFRRSRVLEGRCKL